MGKIKTKVFEMPVVIERDRNGYFGYCPALRGCYTQGKTYEEVLKNLEDAIKLHLKDMIQGKEPIPSIESVSLTTLKVTA